MNKETEIYDLAVIGGGINGIAIAAKAAREGYSCILIEKNDLGSLTSSSSSKLIHGGLRYLEQLDFKLVFESVSARNKLLSKIKYLVEPQEFIITRNQYSRPLWYTRLGLLIYDIFSRKSPLPKSKLVSLSNYKELKENSLKSASYFDAKEDDSRLVILTALDAKQNGANILTKSEVVKFEQIQSKSTWKLTLDSSYTHKHIEAKCIINATGAYVNQTRKKISGKDDDHKIKWIKGSHLIIKKFYKHNKGFLIPCKNKRVIFLIPYLSDYLIVGTTEVEIHDLSTANKVLKSERDYLLDAVNSNFNTNLNINDIVWEYSGTRTLISSNKNATQTSREHVIEHLKCDHCDLINIYGGKITTHEYLAEEVTKILAKLLPKDESNVSQLKFPGSGDIDKAYSLRHQHPWISDTLMKRWVYNYGMITLNLLKDIKQESDMGKHFGKGLYEKEVEYLIENEWAKCTDDILWRRNKLGLEFSDAEYTNLDNWLKEKMESTND